MKKLLSGSLLLALIILFPVPTMAEVNIGISIPLPPLIVFSAPPAMVVIPETYVYVVPDTEMDIFFFDGWWWRPWEGRWYRSRHYDSGWRYYQRVPSFYRSVPSGWRNDYREHRWGGRPWNYQPIPHQQVERNWSSWKKSNHWEKQQTWGVQGLKPRSQQPSKAVQQRSQPRQQSREVQPQQSRPQSREVTKPQQREVQPQRSQPQQREVQPQRSQPQQREVQPQRSQPQQREAQPSKPRQGKPDRGEEEKPDKR